LGTGRGWFLGDSAKGSVDLNRCKEHERERARGRDWEKPARPGDREVGGGAERRNNPRAGKGEGGGRVGKKGKWGRCNGYQHRHRFGQEKVAKREGGEGGGWGMGARKGKSTRLTKVLRKCLCSRPNTASRALCLSGKVGGQKTRAKT